jgi:FkbM family methyltransferase
MWATRALGRFYDRLPFKRKVLSPLRPLRLPYRMYKHLHFEGEFEVATPQRSFRLIHYGEEIENELFWQGLPGRRERVSMALWMRLVRGAEVIVDVGANSGVYSLVAAAMNPAAQVHGFEPLMELFHRYERNCRLNGFDIYPHRTALSNETGLGVMQGWILEKRAGAAVTDGEIVPMGRLDSLIEAEGIGRIDLAKIDVEGHEPEVLEGMGPFLEKCKPTLLIEVLTDRAGERLEAVLDNLRYVYFDLDDVGPPRRSRHIRASSHWNYLICQPEMAAALSLG